MAAPKKPEGEKLKQVKVHVPVKELEIYTRPVIESLIEKHRNEGKIVIGTPYSPSVKPIGYSDTEQALSELIVSAYRRSNNQHEFIRRAKTLK